MLDFYVFVLFIQIFYHVISKIIKAGNKRGGRVYFFFFGGFFF